MTYFIHLILSIILFLIVNWIGKHSISVGYMQLSMFLRNDEAPAFNLLFRVLTPIIFILIISYVFYSLELDYLVISIYSVIIYYFVIRFIVNILFGRSRLVNWPRQIIIASISVIAGYFIYQSIIITKSNLMPDFSTISNELWLIVIIFVYQLFNKISVPTEATKKRKNNYLINRYNLYSSKYASIVKSKVTDKKIEALIYSILLYEAFNRPKVVRLIENIVFRFKKSGTLGIMQVSSPKMIGDKKSVELGIEKILNDYKQIKGRITEEEFSEEYLFRQTISQYNSGSEYLDEICELFDIITQNFYKDIYKDFRLSY